MFTITRRQFIKLAGSGAALSLVGMPWTVQANSPKIVIIGGGIGGVTTARELIQLHPQLDITLLEPHPVYHTCFMSNEVLSGERPLESIQFGYEFLQKRGIRWLPVPALAIDPVTKKVKIPEGELSYDRLVVSPGIQFRWDQIEGYGKAVSEHLPHAWSAPSQVALLRQQLEAMPNGGTVIITVPPHPYRCPPAPYERASQIAYYLKQYKPRSKVLILDAKDGFPKQQLFMQGWEELYGFKTEHSLIEWLPSQEGKVLRVDAQKMAVYAGELEEEYKGSVINVIPPQMAGQIAIDNDLSDDTGWCPVNKKTFESSRHPDVYVIGDACDASQMPKSAYSAHSQAKVCALAIVASLKGEEISTPAYLNTCYSVLGKEYAISLSTVYRLVGDSIAPVEGSGGLTPEQASAEDKKREYLYAHSWFLNFTQGIFGGEL